MLDELPCDCVTTAHAELRDQLASFPPAMRQAVAIALAAQLVEDAAYFNAEDGALPMTTRLLMLSHDLSRISGQFTAAIAA